MDVSPIVAAAFLMPGVGLIVWGVKMDTRVRDVERQTAEATAHNRLIMRGLVRAGFVRQDEVDRLQQDIDDRAQGVPSHG